MKNSIQLSISNPCAADFSTFKKTSQGGFCNSCSKEVIDFTRMTSAEITTYFKNNTSKTCGQFKKKQLTTYQYTNRNYFNIIGGLGLTMFTLLFSNYTYGQTNPIANTIENIQQQKFTLKGTVISETDNEPITGVSIVLKNTTKGTETDFDGKFSLDGLKIGDVLSVSTIGYHSKEIVLKNNNPIKISIAENTEVLNDIVLVGAVDTKQLYKTKRNFWQRVKSIF